MKNFQSILLVFALFVSCEVDNRREAETIIAEFEKENIADKRETVFDVNPAFKQGELTLKGEISNPQKKQDLLNALVSLNFIDEITLLPDSTVGEKTFALVNLSVANMRAEPRYSAELVTQALLGTPVKLLKKQGDWYLVQTPDKYISWANASAITPVTKNELNSWRQSVKVIFTGDFTSVYQSEQLTIPVSDITTGNILEVISRNRNNSELHFPDGRTGFIRNTDWQDFDNFLEAAQPDSVDTPALARKFTGRPYLWGGTSAFAMDCSGFTKMVYFMHGIILARDASLQVRHGQMVEAGESFSQFQPGDLLFFGRMTADSTERITHVAISTGKTEYIHASGRIIENSFDPASNVYSGYRRESFIRARRIIGSEGTEGIQWIKNHPWY
ncbi:MAG: NlpC/P60 family protein [Bacteroidota bacterium]